MYDTFFAYGPRPPGNPDGMRIYAKRLRANADTLAEGVDNAADAVETMLFVGDGGDRSRGRVGRLRSRAHRRATQMRALAAELNHRAGSLETEQRAWDRAQKLKEEGITPDPFRPGEPLLPQRGAR